MAPLPVDEGPGAKTQLEAYWGKEQRGAEAALAEAAEGAAEGMGRALLWA